MVGVVGGLEHWGPFQAEGSVNAKTQCIAKEQVGQRQVMGCQRRAHMPDDMWMAVQLNRGATLPLLGLQFILKTQEASESAGGFGKYRLLGPISGVSSRVAVVQSLSCVQLFATPWTAAYQASLSFTISQSSLKLMPIESMMPSNHLILCCPLLLLPSVFPSRVFSNEIWHRA